MSQAIGDDGMWHEWEELTPQEQQAWMQAMTRSDEIHDIIRSGECAPTLHQNLARYEQKERFIY